MTLSVAHFLILSALLAGAGIATVLTKRNAIGILIGVELLLNAAGLNFVCLAKFHPWNPAGTSVTDGAAFTLFIIVLAAAEAAIALAIILNFYRIFNSVDVDQAQEMQG